jgi:hypothetical protein
MNNLTRRKARSKVYRNRPRLDNEPYEAANKVCEMNRGGIALALLRQRSSIIESSPRRCPAEISAGL